MQHMVWLHSFLDKVKSDWGSQFMPKFWKELLALMDTEVQERFTRHSIVASKKTNIKNEYVEVVFDFVKMLYKLFL